MDFKDLTPIEQEGQRVLTSEQLAEMYGTTTDTIKKNFNRNKDKFVEGKHYFLLEGASLKEFKSLVTNSHLPFNKFSPKLYLWTRQGAARHSKMLGTDKAWDMFDILEENYFHPELTESMVMAQAKKMGLPTTIPGSWHMLADLREEVDQEHQRRIEIENQMIVQTPKANFYDNMMSEVRAPIYATEIAMCFGLSAETLNKALVILGILRKLSTGHALTIDFSQYQIGAPVPIAGRDGNKHPLFMWSYYGESFIYFTLTTKIGLKTVISLPTEYKEEFSLQRILEANRDQVIKDRKLWEWKPTQEAIDKVRAIPKIKKRLDNQDK